MGFLNKQSTLGKINHVGKTINDSIWLNRALKPLSFSFLLASSTAAFSLGVGGVDTKSYIGQPLLVEIPLYNVESPNTLTLNLERVDGQSNNGLSAELSRANSQLSVLIRSQGVVNEPYFNFALSVIDQENEFRKEFTVLLDLSPRDAKKIGYQGSPVQVGIPRVANAVTSDPVLDNNVTGSAAQSTDLVMGPYDWAKAGSIPETFGAVLNGQSLWRVARRISPAMNVTNNQMMWALYQLNPEAFSSASVDSLRAGVYLKIPSVTQVVAVTDTQARNFLAEMSDSSIGEKQAEVKSAPAVAVEKPSSEDVKLNAKDLNAVQSNADDTTKTASTDQFQLSGLSEQVSETGALVGAGDEQSREIIDSLAETISSMTEQLGRKDKQIEVLEEKLSELKAFIQEDDTNGLVESDLRAVPVAEPELSNEQVVLNEQVVESEQGLTSKYTWLLAILGFALTVVFLMRRRLVRLWNALNLSGANDDVDFHGSETVLYDRDDTLGKAGQAGNSTKSTHELFAVKQSGAANDAMPKTGDESLMSFSEYEFDDHSVSEFSEDEFSELLQSDYAVNDKDQTGAEEVVSFDQRFGQLTAEGSLDLARQLLDIAHGHEIESDRYHYHRLQLLAFEKDESEFNDYYRSLEKDIPNFSVAVQTDISKLVVRFSQRDYDWG